MTLKLEWTIAFVFAINFDLLFGSPSKQSSNSFIPPEQDVSNCPYFFCDSSPSYPEDYINALMQNNATKALFATAANQNKATEKRLDAFESESGNENLCCRTTVRIFPKIARNEQHQWKYIADVVSRNGLETEVCLKEDSCAVPSWFTSRRSECKQQYKLRKLWALNYDGSIQSEPFLVPSICSCPQ